jgi:hypothetical protein
VAGVTRKMSHSIKGDTGAKGLGCKEMKNDNTQGDQKVSVRLMITVQKFTSNVRSVPRESPDTRLTLTPSVTPNSNCVIVVSD